MIPITEENKSIAMDIAQEAFIDNPSMLWFLKKDSEKQKRMRALCEYCIDMSIEKRGAFLANDLNGVILIYIYNSRVSILKSIAITFRLIMNCSGWMKVPALAQRDYLSKKLREKEEHVYVFLIASTRKFGNSTIIEMKDFIFETSRRLNMPVCIETGSPDTKKLYERYGFKEYNKMTLPGTQNTIWFLKREAVK